MAELIQYANGVPGIRFPIDKKEFRIGRNEDINDVCVHDNYVSKQHALIEMKKAEQDPGRCEYVLRDLGSTNHTYVNKKAVNQVVLKDNDLIYLGENMFRFRCSDDSQAAYISNTFSRRLRILGHE